VDPLASFLTGKKQQQQWYGDDSRLERVG